MPTIKLGDDCCCDGSSVTYIETPCGLLVPSVLQVAMYGFGTQTIFISALCGGNFDVTLADGVIFNMYFVEGSGWWTKSNPGAPFGGGTPTDAEIYIPLGGHVSPTSYLKAHIELSDFASLDPDCCRINMTANWAVFTSFYCATNAEGLFHSAHFDFDCSDGSQTPSPGPALDTSVAGHPLISIDGQPIFTTEAFAKSIGATPVTVVIQP